MNNICKEIAESLNGVEYGDGFPSEILIKAKENKIVIVSGYSDDIMSLDGFITDESGTSVYIMKDGILENECNDNYCPYFARLKKRAQKIKAIFSPGDGRTFIYETNIPHEEFNVMENDEIYCTGIVFCMDDIKEL